jgi:hypothetical protein
MRYGLKLTPLRAYAHQVPRYYIQNFGSAVSHPDTNEYAAFVQDTIRVTGRLAMSLGVRYDLQTFSSKGLVSNPLWPQAGKVPLNDRNFSPRVGLAYSLGHDHPLVVRAGYGLFYTRIPQIYTSTIATDNGLTSGNLFLDNMDFYQRQVFPTYPTVLANCAVQSTFCAPPANVASYLTSDVAAFAPNFVTPRVHQASLNLERELRPVCRRHFVHVRARPEYDSGTRYQSPRSHQRHLSCLRRDGHNLSRHLLRRALVLYLADDSLDDLSVPTLHQPAGTTHLSPRRHQ